MNARFGAPVTLLISLVLLLGAPAETRANDFYKGKTIRFVVGLAPGGGFDLSARTMGRRIRASISPATRRSSSKHDRRRKPDRS